MDVVKIIDNENDILRLSMLLISFHKISFLKIKIKKKKLVSFLKLPSGIRLK